MNDTSRARSLTGVWQGLFSYPEQFEPCPFTATFIQIGDLISGTIHEPNQEGDGDAETFQATLEGRSRDSIVGFVKTYDGASTRDHSVRYEGILSADGDEIEGYWYIPGVWDGKFLMIRSARYEEAAARKAFARA